MRSPRFMQFVAAFVTLLSFSVPSNAFDLGFAKGLYDQLGGAETVSKMANSLVGGLAKDSRLKSLFGNVDVNALTPKVNDQLCAALGGGCKAPLTSEQITAGAKKLDATQTSAVSDVFKSAMSSSGVSSSMQGLVTKAVGPQLGGILGAML